MKYKFIILLAFALFASLSVFAQSSMTDDQVLKYVVTETQKGTSQQQIATELIKKGVTTAQIQRVRQKAEALKKHANSGKKGNNETAEIRAEETGLEHEEEEVIETSSQEVSGLTEKEQRQVFGRNIFSSKKQTFQSSPNLATPANYVLGAGDHLLINIWGTSQKSFETSITSDGYVVIEEVGPIKLAGLTVERAKTALKTKLSKFYNGCDIDFSVTEVRSVQVQVMGEVNNPGTYTLSSMSSAFNALYMAGGISKIGSLRNIQIFRGGKVVGAIDVYDYILNGKASDNIRLEDEDIIIVGAYNNLVQVKGSVKRPMWYELKTGETVSDLIKFAGNFSGNAYTKNLRVTRKSGEEYSVHTINAERINSFQLADEDIVEVDSIRAMFNNRVEVRGAVKYPGQFELGENIKTVKQLILAAEGLSEMAYEGVAILHRENKDLTIRIQNVDVHGIMNGTSPDMALENNDILFVPNKSETLSERTIDVKGEVVYPGTYPFAENTNIQDILLQTGGLTEAGSMARVDVYRRIKNKEAVKEDINISQSFTFSIDETYAICQDTTFYLQPYDVVIVRKSPSYESQQKVSVQGEINFKGEYTITNKNYRLSDLIKAGGGLTDFAFAKGARLSRAMTTEEIEQQEMSNQIAQIQLYENSLKEGKDLNLEVAKTLYEIKTNKQKRYPVAINLQKALEQQGSNYDIVLRDGDIITIPALSNTIKISGEVMSPVSLTYEEGKSLKYYIKHAGGYSENAARSRVYGIQANGSVVKLSSYSKSDIQPGTEIVVPQKQARRKLSTTEIIGIGSGIAALASVVVALLNVTK